MKFVKFVMLDIETDGLNPFENRITAIAVKWTDKDEIHVFKDESEFVILSGLLSKMKHNITTDTVIVTFNGDKFDLPFIITRSLKNGLNPWFLQEIRMIDLFWMVKKYMATSYRTPPKTMSQQNIARFVGIEVTDETTGKDMLKFWEERNFKAIEEHVRADIEVLEKMFNRFKPIVDYDLKKRYSGWYSEG